MWQDAVLAFGSVILSVTLIPMIRHEHKPPLLTSGPSAFFLMSFAVCYVTLGLPLAAITTALSGTGWLVLFFQKLDLWR